MKFIFLIGGALGFLLTAVAGLTAGRAFDRVLFDSALGCLVGAILFRWLWNVLLNGMRETFVTRQRAARAAAATAAAAAKSKP